MILPQLFLATALALGLNQETTPRPTPDLTQAARDWARSQALADLPPPWLGPASYVQNGQSRQPILNGYARSVLEYKRYLGHRLHFTMEPRTIGPGPKIEFRPNRWATFWSGPLYDSRYAQFDVLFALKLDLWRFNL